MSRLAPFGFVLLWASSFIASRAGLRYLSPMLFVTVRLVLAAAVMVGVMAVLGRSWRALAGRWGHLVVAGVLTNSVLLLTAHYAMVHVGAAQIALVQTLNPLLTALLAWPLLGERLRWLQWVGLVLGAAGVVLIVGMAAASSPLELHGLLLTAGGVVGLWRPDPGGHDGATARGRRCLRRGDGRVRDAARGVGRFRDSRDCLERRSSVPRGDGALLPDAGARYSGAGNSQFLPCAGHRGLDGLGVAWRTFVGTDRGGTDHLIDRLLVGEPPRA
jgi:uncharacterized membrane protein